MLHGKVQIKNCDRNIKRSRKSKKERNCYDYRNNGLLDIRLILLILLTSEQYTLKIFYIVNKKADQFFQWIDLPFKYSVIPSAY